jgi:predicted enzyme related to lactoylglutathione lyase
MNNGTFVWYELGTTDPEAAASFYKQVVGWEAQAIPEMHYTILQKDGARIAGVMQLPEHVRAQGVPPHWVGYINVDDVDAYAKRAEEAGATLRHGPEDIPGIGRFAVLTDPDGAPFNLFKTNGEGGPETPPMTPGHIGWHELMARSGDAGFDFYSGLFGWTRGEAMPMGPMGVYQLFDYGGRSQGGMMTAPEGAKPGWMFYFVVSGIDAAQARVTEAGGTVRNGPMEVPGGAWILQCQDPQGASFAMVSMAR